MIGPTDKEFFGNKRTDDKDLDWFDKNQGESLKKEQEDQYLKSHGKFLKSEDEPIDYDNDEEIFETALNQEKNLTSEVDSDWFDYNQDESVKKEQEDQYLRSHRKFWKSGDEPIDYDYNKEIFQTVLIQDKTLKSDADSDWFDYNKGESLKKEQEDQYLKENGKFWKLGDEPVDYDYNEEIFDTALN